MGASSYLWMAGIWVLYFWLYRTYRLDKFRHNLFVLRDELFDLALDGQVSFESRAYRLLRQIINGMIQYGHRYNFLGLSLWFFFVRCTPKESAAKRGFQRNWESACEEISTEGASQLVALRRRVHVEIVKQIFFTSPILLMALGSVLFVAGLFRLKKTIESKIGSVIQRDRFRGVLASIDNSAVFCS